MSVTLTTTLGEKSGQRGERGKENQKAGSQNAGGKDMENLLIFTIQIVGSTRFYEQVKMNAFL
eukprot:m.123638 g.123638  ORF g.123638 m.123638 type:complete len:63 (-) comp23394_c0_seq2:2186-2374(-)